MTTIRRLYVYVVCFISLQAVVAAGNALARGLIRQLAGTDAPDPFFFTLQLAILIVGTPIFLGHWLWALALLRRDAAEREAFSYRLYLYASQGVFMGYLAFALHDGAQALAELGLALSGRRALAAHGSALVQNLITAAGMAVLWLYHDRLARDRRLAHTPAQRLLYQLYHLGWAGLGLTLLAIGVGGLQFVLLSRLGGSAAGDGPQLLALAAAGGPLWAFHELRRARDTRLHDATAGTLRWLYATIFASAGVITALVGLDRLQRWVYDTLRGDVLTVTPPQGMALLTTGLALAVYHDLAVRRTTTHALLPLRWLYALVAAGLSLYLAVTGAQTGVRWLVLSLRQFTELPVEATLVLPALLAWAYHQWVMQRASGPLALAEPSTEGFRNPGRFLRRLYLYGFSGLGVGLTAFGLVVLQQQLFTGLAGLDSTRTRAVAEAVGALLIGLPLWVYCWRWAGRLFHGPVPDERQSDLRKFYLYTVIYVTVNAVIITAGLLLNGIFRRMLGLPTASQGGQALAIILAAAALWAYHAWVLRRDLARSGNTSLTPSLQRLYWYLVAALGLSAFVLGLAGEVSVAVRWLAGRFAASVALRADLAQFTAAWLAGLPVWLLVWVPAQRAARQPGPAGAGHRRSTLRKLYLYAFALAAVVMALSSAINVVYQLLNAVFGIFEGGNVFSDVAQSLGFAVISTAVWLYHAWVLRGDGRSNQADRAAQTEAETTARAAAAAQLTAEWAAWPVVVVDDGDGSFAEQMLADLRRDLPYVTLLPVALNPAAAAALGRPLSADVTASLAGASLVVAPSSALHTGSPVAASPAPKVVVPITAPGLHWVGMSRTTPNGSAISQTVLQLLRNLRPQLPATAKETQTPTFEPPAPPEADAPAASAA